MRLAAEYRIALLAAGVFLNGPAAWAACATLPAGSVPVPLADILARFPGGGGALTAEIRNQVAADPGKLSGIVALIAAASPSQRQAMGAGLGQAAAVCTRPEPDTARRIQEAVVGANSPDVVLAFQGVTGDRQTTAVGGGAGGAGGGGGGLGGGGVSATSSSSGGGGSSYVPTSTSTTTNSALNYSAGSSVFAGLASRAVIGTAPATTLASPVTSASQNRP